MSNDTPMTRDEFTRLDALEQRINTVWDEAALALGQIKDGKLYRRTRDCKKQTWDQYCQRVHGITPQWANKLIRRAKTLERIKEKSETTVSLSPTASGQLEGLATEDQVEIVQEATKNGRRTSARDIAEEKHKKLMSRFEPGGDMHNGGSNTKSAPIPSIYKLTVVTPTKADLEAFVSLLPSPTIDLKAHSVAARIGLTDINNTLTAVGKVLTISQPKKVRIVVEL